VYNSEDDSSYRPTPFTALYQRLQSPDTNTATKRIKGDVAGHPVKTAVLPDTRPSPSSPNSAGYGHRKRRDTVPAAAVTPKSLSLKVPVSKRIRSRRTSRERIIIARVISMSLHGEHEGLSEMQLQLTPRISTTCRRKL
jgi:hypothetical protein